MSEIIYGPQWKRVAQFQEQHMPKFAELMHIKVNRRMFTPSSSGIGEDEHREYVCIEEHCKLRLNADRLANAPYYEVHRLGWHKCGFNFPKLPMMSAEQQHQQPTPVTIMQEKQNKTSKVSKSETPKIPKASANKKKTTVRLTRSMAAKNVSAVDIENEETDSALGDSTEDEPSQMVLMEIQQPKLLPLNEEKETAEPQQQEQELMEIETGHNDENQQLAAQQPNFAQRQQILEEMAKELGLVFRALRDEAMGMESYFFTGPPPSTPTIESSSVSAVTTKGDTLMLQFKRGVGAHWLMAVLKYSTHQLLWSTEDWDQFLWALRGLCRQTLLPKKMQVIGPRKEDTMVSSRNMETTAPIVTEPPDEDDRAGSMVQVQSLVMPTFALNDKGLALADLASDMNARMEMADAEALLSFELQGQRKNAVHRHQLFFKDTGSQIHVFEKWTRLSDGAEMKRSEVQKWRKLDHGQFRCAVRGKTVHTFGRLRHNCGRYPLKKNIGARLNKTN